MLKLHHCAKKIRPATLNFVIKLFTQLDCQISYKPTDSTIWAMIEQDSLRFDIQFIEVDQEPQPTNIKKESHIAFLSEDPQQAIQQIQSWVESQGKKFIHGSWSQKEHYFDCPDVFVDFVIEIMHTSIVEG